MEEKVKDKLIIRFCLLNRKHILFSVFSGGNFKRRDYSVCGFS